MIAEPVTDEELQLAKDMILNSEVFSYDTKREVLDRLVLFEMYGYEPDFLQQYQAAVKNLTPADIQTACQENWKPADLSFLVVGTPADDVDDLGQCLAPVPEDPQASVVRREDLLVRGLLIRNRRTVPLPAGKALAEVVRRCLSRGGRLGRVVRSGQMLDRPIVRTVPENVDLDLCAPENAQVSVSMLLEEPEFIQRAVEASLRRLGTDHRAQTRTAQPRGTGSSAPPETGRSMWISPLRSLSSATARSTGRLRSSGLSTSSPKLNWSIMMS